MKRNIAGVAPGAEGTPVAATEVTLAVVIPNYNDSRYLPLAVRSVMRQEVAADEVIVVDDCSTDDSLEVIASLVAEFPRLRVLRNEVNLGVYGAIAAGRDATRSDYVLIVAANDFLLQGLIGRAKRCLAEHPGAGIWSAMGWQVDEQTRLLGPIALAVPSLRERYFSPGQCRQLARRFGNWFAGPSVVYHRQLMEGVGAFNPQYKGLADLICALMVAAKAGAVFSPEPLVVVRIHSGSYLSSTLARTDAYSQLLRRMANDAPAVAPELFDAAFTGRCIRRFVFAAINKSRGRSLADFAPLVPALPAAVLRWTEAAVPERFGRLRTAMAFLALRSFDIGVSLWNRAILCRAVSARHAARYKEASAF